MITDEQYPQNLLSMNNTPPKMVTKNFIQVTYSCKTSKSNTIQIQTIYLKLQVVKHDF